MATCQPSSTNCPKAFREQSRQNRKNPAKAQIKPSQPVAQREKAQASYSENVQSERSFSIEAFEPYRPTGAWVSGKEKRQGDDSVRDPPLPIPNREVKPHRADGTAKVGE